MLHLGGSCLSLCLSLCLCCRHSVVGFLLPLAVGPSCPSISIFMCGGESSAMSASLRECRLVEEDSFCLFLLSLSLPLGTLLLGFIKKGSFGREEAPCLRTLKQMFPAVSFCLHAWSDPQEATARDRRRRQPRKNCNEKKRRKRSRKA